MTCRASLKSISKAAFPALSLVIASAAFMLSPSAVAIAQTGGGTSGGGGAGTSGGGTAGPGASPGAGPGASPGGAGTVAPRSPGATSPGATPGVTPGAGTARDPGGAARPGASPALPRTGIRPVPSPGNAEPTSPIHRQNEMGAGGQPDTRTPRREAIDPGVRAPQADPLPGGSGGTARTDGTSGSRPLDPAPSSDGASDGTLGSEPVEERKSGAGGPTLSECMDAWDAGTNMTRQDWRRTCERLGR